MVGLFLVASLFGVDILVHRILCTKNMPMLFYSRDLPQKHIVTAHPNMNGCFQTDDRSLTTVSIDVDCTWRSRVDLALACLSFN